MDNILLNQCKYMSLKRFIHWLWINGEQWPIYAESFNGNRATLQSLLIVCRYSHLTEWFQASQVPHISRILHCAASSPENCTQTKHTPLNKCHCVYLTCSGNCRSSPRLYSDYSYGSFPFSPTPLSCTLTLFFLSHHSFDYMHHARTVVSCTWHGFSREGYKLLVLSVLW